MFHVQRSGDFKTLPKAIKACTRTTATSPDVLIPRPIPPLCLLASQSRSLEKTQSIL